MPQISTKLTSPDRGIYADEVDTKLPVQLKHVLPGTLFTISLSELSSFVLEANHSIFDVQTGQEWSSLEAFCAETCYNLETTIDAWYGEVINPDLEAQQEFFN
jgi:hypothetical protein